MCQGGPVASAAAWANGSTGGSPMKKSEHLADFVWFQL
jgi:hypothetical protein